MKLYSKVVKEPNLSGFLFYIEPGEEFDASAYEYAYEVKVPYNEEKRINAQVRKLKQGEFLEVSHFSKKYVNREQS